MLVGRGKRGSTEMQVGVCQSSVARRDGCTKGDCNGGHRQRGCSSSPARGWSGAQVGGILGDIPVVQRLHFGSCSSTGGEAGRSSGAGLGAQCVANGEEGTQAGQPHSMPPQHTSPPPSHTDTHTALTCQGLVVEGDGAQVALEVQPLAGPVDADGQVVGACRAGQGKAGSHRHAAVEYSSTPG